MRVTASATRFRAAHSVSSIRMLAYVLRIGGFVKARPARSGIELCAGFKQRRATPYTVIHAALMIVPVLASKGTLRTGFPRHVILLGSQLLPPFIFRFHNFLGQFFG